MNEKYLDALYRFQEMLCEDFCAFVEDTAKHGMTEGRICYADTMMHLAKNLRKEQLIEEGFSPEEIEGYSGSNQGYGRAIRTTPGVSGNGRSMRGTGKTAYKEGSSGARDSRGRYASSGADGDMFNKMQKMADMTADHTEREIIMNMIERLKGEN